MGPSSSTRFMYSLCRNSESFIIVLKCILLIDPIFCLTMYDIDNCFRKIFNVKSKNTVHECEIEFQVLLVSDVIRKTKISHRVRHLR